ncbi:MAG: hypothetical protein GXZ11_08115 [Tissierellia bacterium]|nr:hypothetical protein [Tissierellia bacterium]
MVIFVVGAKGVGKTRWLINNANKDMKEGNGNIAFVDVDDDHIFSLDYNVRLINAMEYGITDSDMFYGFICGMLAMDYDLEKIYVDSIYKILNFSTESLVYLFEKLQAISDQANTKIYINMEGALDQLPEGIRENAVEITGDEE